MAPRIREATRQDAPVLLALIREAFQTVYDRFDLRPETWSRHAAHMQPSWLHQMMDEGCRFFILEAADGPVGCIALQQAEPTAVHLRRLAVLPGHRGQGYGRLLMQHALAEARRLGARRATLVFITGNTELEDWYTRLGFRATETKVPEHFPLRCTWMAMDL